MARYRYEALTRTGDIVAGEIDAESRSQAVECLRLGEQIPTRLEELAPTKATPWLLLRRATRGWNSTDLLDLTRGLTALLKAGLTIDRSLAIFLDSSQNYRVEVIRRLHDKVRHGASLADALEQEGATFPPYYSSTIRAGESSGTLPFALQQLEVLLTNEQQMRERIASIVIYPLILLAMMLATLLLVLLVVLPRLEAMFSESQLALPLATRLLMAASHGLRDYGWMVGIVAVVSVLAVRHIGRARVDGFLLRQNWYRQTASKIELARFARVAAASIGGGVPLPHALTMAAGALRNTFLFALTTELITRLRQGERLASLFLESKQFPLVMVQLVRVGEETGELAEMLEEVAAILDQEAQVQSERYLVALVPALTIFIGMLVALVIGSVLVSLLSMHDLVL